MSLTPLIVEETADFHSSRVRDRKSQLRKRITRFRKAPFTDFDQVPAKSFLSNSNALSLRRQHHSKLPHLSR